MYRGTMLSTRELDALRQIQPGRIVLQQLRHNSPAFNAALLGFVEARRDDDVPKLLTGVTT